MSESDREKPKRSYRKDPECYRCSGRWSKTEFLVRRLNFRRLNIKRHSEKRGKLNHQEVEHLTAFYRTQGDLLGICYRHMREYAYISDSTIQRLGRQIHKEVKTTDPAPDAAHSDQDEMPAGLGLRIVAHGGKHTTTKQRRPEMAREITEWLDAVSLPRSAPNAPAIISASVATTRIQLHERFVAHLVASGERGVGYKVFWRMIPRAVAFQR